MGVGGGEMQGLRREDLLRLLEVLPDLYSGQGSFAERAISALSKLIDSEVTSYNELDPATHDAVMAIHPWDGLRFPDAEAVFAELMPEHPHIHHYQRTGDGRPLRISDLLSLREFQQTALYQDFYRRVGVDRQMALTLPSAPGEVIGLALSRRGRDFTDRERLLAAALRPHLVQAYANTRATAGLELSLQLSEEALERLGRPLAILNPDGRVRFVTEAAARLVAQRAGETVRGGRSLPASVGGPLAAALKRHRLGEKALTADGPIHLSTPVGDLRVRLVQLLPEGWLAMFEETVPPASPSLPITRREGDVLRLVAMGMSNKEVGAELGISPRTVEKHLEKIRATLGVSNRTAAALRALYDPVEVTG